MRGLALPSWLVAAVRRAWSRSPWWASSSPASATPTSRPRLRRDRRDRVRAARPRRRDKATHARQGRQSRRQGRRQGRRRQPVERRTAYVEVYNNSGVTGLAGDRPRRAAGQRLAGRGHRQLVRRDPRQHRLLPAAAEAQARLLAHDLGVEPAAPGGRADELRPDHGHPDRRTLIAARSVWAMHLPRLTPTSGGVTASPRTMRARHRDGCRTRLLGGARQRAARHRLRRRARADRRRPRHGRTSTPARCRCSAGWRHGCGAVAVVTGRPVGPGAEPRRVRGAEGLDALVILGQYGVERWDARSGEVAAPEPPPGHRAGPPARARAARRARPCRCPGRGQGPRPRPARAPAARPGRRAGAAARAGARRWRPSSTCTSSRASTCSSCAAAASTRAAPSSTLLEETGATTVVYAGDDVGDIAAFDAVERHREGGGHGLLIWSESDESPRGRPDPRRAGRPGARRSRRGDRLARRAGRPAGQPVTGSRAIRVAGTPTTARLRWPPRPGRTDLVTSVGPGPPERHDIGLGGTPRQSSR